jgi:hypothetical protein
MKKSLILLNKVVSWLLGIGYGAESIEKEIKTFMKFIPNGETFVDVGGNKGLYSSILMKKFGKLPQKLKRFEIESVKQKLYEKFKIYGVTNRCDFKTSRRWHVGQRDLSSTRHQPADIF